MTIVNDGMTWLFPEVGAAGHTFCIGENAWVNPGRINELELANQELREKLNQLTLQVGGMQAEKEQLGECFRTFVEQSQALQIENREQAFSTLVSVTKKICAMIIKKEIQLDDRVLKNIFLEITTKFGTNEHLKVYACPSDSSLLKKEIDSERIDIITDESLRAGELVVTDGSSGYMHQVDEVIDKLLDAAYVK